MNTQQKNFKHLYITKILSMYVCMYVCMYVTQPKRQIIARFYLCNTLKMH